MTATNKTGVFSLEKISDRQSNNKWSTILDPYVFLQSPVSSPTPNTGYTLGGYNGPYLSNVDRIDFSNDTATAAVKGPLSQARNRLGSSSNSTHAYAGGGAPGAGQFASFVDRVDFASDTGTASPKGPLASNGYWRQATGNLSFGYFGASYGGPDKGVERIDYSNDTVAATPVGDLVKAHWAGGATGNTSYGYFGGGAGTGAGSTISRIDYASDSSTASPKGPLSSPRTNNGYKLSATGNSNYGYWMGAQSSPATLIDRLDYSSDTTTAVAKGALPGPHNKYAASATGNSDYGYYMGGFSGNVPNVSRIDYSNDTATASPKGPLSSGRAYLTATSARENGFPTTITQIAGDKVKGSPIASNGPNTGYSAGGRQPSPYDGGMSVVDRIDYSNDTATASARGNLPSGFYSWGNTGTSTLDYGYITSGYNFNSSNPPTGRKTTLMRTDYSNDLATPSLRGGLIQPKYYAAAMGNTSYGYWAGGDPSPRHFLQRFDWSNDSADSVLKTPFSGNRYSMGATGTPSYAYFGGGDAAPQPSPSNSSRIERLDMSNDDAAVVQKGSLQRVSSQTAATGSPAYGYWHQVANPGTTYIERLDYANDTSNTVDKGPLSVARKQASLIGSRDYGYWMTGKDPYNATTRVDRLDFNNDTNTATPKGPMSSARYGSAGTFSSRANALAAPQRVRFIDSAPVPRGYFAGGFNNNSYAPVGPGMGPSRFSTIERYDFDNDTSTGSQVASLINNGVHELGSISSPAFSYFIGGSGTGPNTVTGPYMSTIQRLDLTNETFTTRGNTSGIWYRINITGNANYGYISGVNRNTPWPYGSKIERIDFSNDNGTGTMPGAVSTFSAAQGGPRAAVSSSNYGYYGGGHTPSPLSTVERLDFGSDTSNLVTKGPLSIARQGLGALASPAYGYFGGGVANPGGTYYSTIDRIDFANDTATASPKSTLTVIKKEFAGVSNSSYGYFGGGYNVVPGGNNYLSSTDRLDFANDTSNTVSKGPLTGPRNNLTGTSAILAAPPAPVEPPFPSPTQAPAPAPSMGYVLGSGTNVQRIDYTNDTATAPTKGPLSATTSYHSAVSSKTHGYTFGGPPGPGNSLIQRIDYSNDTATAPTVANLAQPVYRTYSGMGNKTYGYQSGGQRPSTTGTSNVDRIEYASDTSTGLLKGNLASSRYLQTATGNLSYGYVCGGSPPFQNNSLVQRVDYGNDTATATPKGPLHQGSRKLTATGTASYGYVAGGTNPDLSSTTRIDYSNDTATSVQKGSMTVTREQFSSMSSPAYGYYMGGSSPTKSSTDRLDYANDTANLSPKGPLSVAVSNNSAASPQDIAGALN